MSRLRAGDVYELPPACEDGGRRYEVLRVTACSATVRCATRERRTIQTAAGEVAFDAPGRPFQIAPNAGVVIVSRVPRSDRVRVDE